MIFKKQNPRFLVLPCEVATMPEGAFYGQEGEVARAQRPKPEGAAVRGKKRVTEGSCKRQSSNECRTTPRRNDWSCSSQTYSKNFFTRGDPLLSQGVTF
jgi:hypothetical protein